MQIIVGLFILVIVYYLGLAIWKTISALLESKSTSFSLEFKTFAMPNKPAWERTLVSEFDFYNKLPTQSKKEFLRRMKMFYHDKNFIGKGGIRITERMKILICASAAQLTFGLPRLKLPHFDDILIYPSKYLNKRTGRMHMGEMSSQGKVVFSWEHIEKSLADPHDGYNLLLHELAHAMRFEDYYPNEERHFLRQEDVNRLHHLFRKLQAPIKSRVNYILE